MKAQAVKPPTWKAWFLATRPKTLSISTVPVLAGSLLAQSTGISVDWLLVFVGWISVMLIQIGTNLVNDAIDSKKGADTEERLGPLRATQQGWLSQKQVLGMGLLCFALSLVNGIPLMLVGGWPILALMIVSCVMGYIYTGGPFPLAYHGLGDVFTFTFFGIACTTVFYYLQAHEISTGALLAGSQIGLFSMAILGMNNLRDCHQDVKVNKRTFPVRFGVTAGRMEITLALLLPFVLNAVWWSWGYSFAALLPLVTLPMVLSILRFIWTHEPSILYNKYFGMTAMLDLLFGLLLSLGFALA